MITCHNSYNRRIIKSHHVIDVTKHTIVTCCTIEYRISLSLSLSISLSLYIYISIYVYTLICIAVIAEMRLIDQRFCHRVSHHELAGPASRRAGRARRGRPETPPAELGALLVVVASRLCGSAPLGCLPTCVCVCMRLYVCVHIYI